jgi:hypothetical protein
VVVVVVPAGSWRLASPWGLLVAWDGMVAEAIGRANSVLGSPFALAFPRTVGHPGEGGSRGPRPRFNA